jgi:hypothetical protein
MTDKAVQNRDKFLKELSALSRRYKIKIGGCGCCGSPWLADVEGRGGKYESNGGEDGLVFVQPDGARK